MEMRREAMKDRVGFGGRMVGVGQRGVKDDDSVHQQTQSQKEGELLGRKRINIPCTASYRTRHLVTAEGIDGVDK